MEGGEEGADAATAEAVERLPLGPASAAYLDAKVTESFKRQTDLEESIWRSLPLLTGALIVAPALIHAEGSALPAPSLSFYVVAVYLLFAGALLFFGGSLWWLWQIVRPRDYEYPPDDAAVADYASQLVAYHSGEGHKGETLDALVLADLRSYMTESLVRAARSHLANNGARISARSQVLLYLLCGFVLSFSGEAIIHGHKFLFEGPQVRKVLEPRGEEDGQHSLGREDQAARSSSNEGHSRRGLDNQVGHGSPNQEQEMSDKPKPPPTASGAGQSTRPKRPPMQMFTKQASDGRTIQGSTQKPAASPSPKPKLPE